jgi:hypothetical protein
MIVFSALTVVVTATTGSLLVVFALRPAWLRRGYEPTPADFEKGGSKEAH